MELGVFNNYHLFL